MNLRNIKKCLEIEECCHYHINTYTVFILVNGSKLAFRIVSIKVTERSAAIMRIMNEHCFSLNSLGCFINPLVFRK